MNVFSYDGRRKASSSSSGSSSTSQRLENWFQNWLPFLFLSIKFIQERLIYSATTTTITHKIQYMKYTFSNMLPFEVISLRRFLCSSYFCYIFSMALAILAESKSSNNLWDIKSWKLWCVCVHSTQAVETIAWSQTVDMEVCISIPFAELTMGKSDDHEYCPRLG